MKKNIILLTGNDAYGIEQEVRRWVHVFSEKYNDLNIEHISLNSLKENAQNIRQNILSLWLFAEKRLFIISWGNEKRDKTTDFSWFFSQIFSEIPDDHFILFHWLKERAIELMPIIGKIWDVKKFDWIYNISLWKSRFEKLDTKIIEYVVREYEMMESILEEWEKNTSLSHKIAWTLENLDILALTEEIRSEHIDELIWSQWGAKIFDLIDAVSNNELAKALSIFKKISESKNAYEILSSYISLLRNILYIKYLASKNLSTAWIKIHPYVLKKTLVSKISYSQISILYGQMVKASISYKSGKWMKDNELWIILEIELGIMWLKK